MDKYAAIDLGTNTFHLLIASFDREGKLVEHFRQRNYVHLAKDGISEISEDAMQRSLDSVKEFSEHLARFDIKEVVCSGTAALRTACNGEELVRSIEKILGFHVNVIDGITEAKYIYQGVTLAIPELREGNHLIMDIGGGSVEFIVIKNGHFMWSSSYPIGIAVLSRKFHKTEPITRDELILTNQFIRDHIVKLLYICRGMKFESLVGASGSFEVLSGMVSHRTQALSVDVSVERFMELYDKVIHSNLDERLEMNDIPNDRAALIVVAMQLIHFILSHLPCKVIKVSKYAMKEGMITNLAPSKNNF